MSFAAQAVSAVEAYALAVLTPIHHPCAVRYTMSKYDFAPTRPNALNKCRDLCECTGAVETTTTASTLCCSFLLSSANQRKNNQPNAPDNVCACYIYNSDFRS